MDLAGILSKIRLFCDGCGGQNKNSHIIHALLFWLVNKSPENVKEIQLTFPVRGNSFLPADRVFGRIEKDIGEIKKLGQDWITKDIKSLEECYKKVEGLRDVKRVVLKKHLVTKKTGRSVQTITKYLINTYKNYRNESEEERKPICLLKEANITQQNF